MLSNWFVKSWNNRSLGVATVVNLLGEYKSGVVALIGVVGVFKMDLGWLFLVGDKGLLERVLCWFDLGVVIGLDFVGLEGLDLGVVMGVAFEDDRVGYATFCKGIISMADENKNDVTFK